MKKIATHDGQFHTDEVFAVAVLKLMYPDIKIVRTRETEKFEKADFRVDIGRKYNPETGDFDHHQKEFKEKRKNKIPYASAGLIWKHFGGKLIKSKNGFEHIDKILMQPIDSIDNGEQICLKKIIENYGIGQVISSFAPDWQEKNSDYDKSFDKAVLFATELLKREILSANGIEKAEEIIKNILSKSDKEYIILEKHIPWKKYIIENTNINFVIGKNYKNNWEVWTVPIKLGSFERKKLFPKKWADLNDNEFVKATGINDVIFCHKDRFIAATKSKSGAIKLVKLALKEK